MPGIYINHIQDSSNIDTIKIYRDGTYERFIYDKANNKLIFKNKSIWVYSETNIKLNKFLENYGGHSSENMKKSYEKYLFSFFLAPSKKGGKIYLIYGENDYEYFIKVNKPDGADMPHK
jgi:hypothetical protein